MTHFNWLHCSLFQPTCLIMWFLMSAILNFKNSGKYLLSNAHVKWNHTGITMLIYCFYQSNLDFFNQKIIYTVNLNCIEYLTVSRYSFFLNTFSFCQKLLPFIIRFSKKVSDLKGTKNMALSHMISKWKWRPHENRTCHFCATEL